jgi:predicted XRE-type DNA-binding protein
VTDYLYSCVINRASQGNREGLIRKAYQTSAALHALGQLDVAAVPLYLYRNQYILDRKAMTEKLEYSNIFESITDDASLAADLQFRSDLIMTLIDIIEAKGWKQAEIAKALDIPQPRVSELLRGKISLFSSDRLIGYLARLGVRLRPSMTSDHQVVCEVEMEAA